MTIEVSISLFDPCVERRRHQIELTAVWPAHRVAAFDAGRYLIEELESHAPFRKKEQVARGVRRVECNTPAA